MGQGQGKGGLMRPQQQMHPGGVDQTAQPPPQMGMPGMPGMQGMPNYSFLNANQPGLNMGALGGHFGLPMGFGQPPGMGGQMAGVGAGAPSIGGQGFHPPGSPFQALQQGMPGMPFGGQQGPIMLGFHPGWAMGGGTTVGGGAPQQQPHAAPGWH